MNKKPRITIYENIINDFNKINAWTIYECLPIKELKSEQEVKDICVIEVTFDGTHGNVSLFNEIAIEFNTFIEKYLFINDTEQYLFTVSEKEKKNRIRSYKGIFSKKIEKKDYIQEEFELENNYSIIVGLAKVSKNNYKSISHLLFDRTSSFLLLSEDKFLSKFRIQELKENIIDSKLFTVNYLKLCINYCLNNNIIIREAGDGGDEEFSWQFFINKNYKSKVLHNIYNILSDNTTDGILTKI